MAVRACIVEGKGECSPDKLKKHRSQMETLWKEISALADFDNDGKISAEEFKDAVNRTCVGKKYDQFPEPFKAFVESSFNLLDINSDGIVGLEEYRYNCISRIAIDDVGPIDKAFESLLNDDDRKKGGLDITRYKELYAQFLGNKDDKHQAVNLFGPL
uniref:EF-hand domain-containing protein n=1 Tax=Megaselia scalaris TaxID=36166 RepID=T1GMP9_MEGSC